MRRYELMLLLSPDLEDDKLQAAVEKVTRAIVNGGGSLTKVSPWGKRRLAYDIGRHREASYFLIQFDIEPAQVREIERGMLITEEILRHLVTVLEDRGTTDELAPAAAARPDDEEDFAPGGTAAFSASDDDDSDEHDPSDGTSDDTPDDEADAEPGRAAGPEPADEERAAG